MAPNSPNSPGLEGPLRDRRDFEALLATVTNYEEKMPKRLVPRAFRLARTESLLELLGHPQRSIPTVHVAGSKGKGSVCRMVASILEAQDQGTVGLYTSPHIEDLAERVMIGRRPATGAELAEAAEQLRRHVLDAQGTDQAPTFFEILTAVAWGVFAKTACKNVVLETGLGGRLDSTNTCAPTITAITPIELEHTALLGHTIAEVAGEKAGIIKPAVPVVTSATEEALRVIAKRANEMKAPLYAHGHSFECYRVEPNGIHGIRARISIGSSTNEYAIPVLGLHQGENAAVAAMIARSLKVDWNHIRAGLESVKLPAAMELMSTDPIVVLDGAHTTRSANAARTTLDTWWPQRKRVVLVAMLRTKKAETVLPDLIADAHTVITTQVTSPRAVPAGDLSKTVAKLTDARVVAEPDPAKALDVARGAMNKDEVCLVSGSLYLAGVLRPLLRSSS